ATPEPSHRWERTRMRRPPLRPEPEPEYEARPQPPSKTQAEMDEVNSRIQSDPDMADTIPPVQTFPDTSTEPSRIYATSKEIQAVNRRPRRLGGISRPQSRDTDSGAHVLRPGLSDIDLRHSVSRPAPPALIWLAAAAVFVFAVLAVILYIRHRPQHTVPANPYPAAVRKDVRLALAAKVPGQQDLFLARAKQNLALDRQNGDAAASINKLQLSLAGARDTVYHITRENSPVVLAKFQQPTEMAVSPDTVYVLDAGKKLVYSVSPGNTNSAPTEIVQAGEQDSGFTFATPTHVATSGSTALVLDGNNTLIRDSAGTKTATSLTRPSPSQQVNLIANFGPDVYLLDTAGNQIWRYPDAVQGYNSQPGGFFSPNTPDTGNIVSFALDDKDLYALKSSGSVVRFNSQTSSPEPYTVSLRTPLKQPDAIFTDVGLSYVWVADPGNARIVQLDKNGKYIRSYVAGQGSGMNFKQIKGIAVPPDGKTLYVLAGTQLYSFPVAP
ncbi:MAG: hypothetical protein ACRDFX_02235, partial [Chloroflexota bacterium]